MKVLVLNGSPRQGNTVTAINALVEGLDKAYEVEIVDTYKLKLSPCYACGACGCKNGCVAQDDSNVIADKCVAADVIIFASPVYWWGVTAQMKLVIDKLYCRGAMLKGKKIGTIAIGGASTDDREYRLIREQLECIAEYLGWEYTFSKEYSASGTGDLAKKEAALAELKAEGGKF